MVIRRSFFLILVFSWWLVACNRQAVTPASGPQLRSDCARLLEQWPQGEVPKEKWPRSVKDLKPLRVQREADRIAILQSHKDGEYSVGYYIYSDPQAAPSTQRVWIQKTEWPGVFIYKTQY